MRSAVLNSSILPTKDGPVSGRAERPTSTQWDINSGVDVSAQQPARRLYSLLRDHDEFAQRTAEHLIRFVNRVEEASPDHEHVIVTGGKDSYLISLVPKRTDNWHVLSFDPNYPLVTEFAERSVLSPSSRLIVGSYSSCECARVRSAQLCLISPERGSV